MARRKGVSKSRNTGARKISTNISLPLKGDNRLNDDPGGTRSENMDGSKVISSEKHQSYNRPVNPRVDHQLNYGNSPVIELSNNRQQNSNTTKTPSVSTSDQNDPVLITTRDETSETRTSTERTNNNNNNNNNKSHHSNSSINSSTTMTTVTSSNDLKYLHKKFKRIASAATSEIFDAVDKIHHHHHTHHHTNKKLNNIIGNRKDGGESRSPSESLEIISKSTTNNFKEQQQFRNSSYSIGNHEDSSHVIYNGTGRLSPLFQTIEASPKPNTGYCSDGEMKSSISNNYSVTSSQSANHQIIKPLSIQKLDDPLVSNSLYKSNEISPQQYPVNHGTIANHNSNNNVLGRVSISPISTTSRNISTATTSSSNPIVAVVGNNVQYSKSSVSQSSTSASQLQRPQSREVDQNITGRYTCPFCNLNCTKPSVLQKHIRAHTNERPYPCDTCCFAFKTKSNYYKHCRSRTHALRVKGIDPQPDDENSIGSDPDPDPDFSNSSSDVISRTASPLDERTSSPAIQFPAAAVIQQYHKYSNDKPYKPKFHNAALYVKEEYSPQRHQSQIQQPPLSHQPQQQQLQQQLQPIQIPNIHYTTNHHQQHLPQNYLPSSHIQQQDQDSSSLYQQQHQQPAKNRLEYALQHTPQLLQQVSLQTPAFSDTSRDATSTSAISGRPISSASNVGHQLNVEEHISNLISRNEAIVENKELLLQKKYPKVSGKTKNSTLILPTSSNSRLAYVLNNKQQQQQQQHSQQQSYQPQMITISTNGILPSVSLQLSKMGAHTQSVQQQQPHQLPSEPTSTQPLNLSKLGEQLDNTMKRMSTESTAIQSTSSENVPASSGKNLATHPQNPERSIIKHLLLNARGQAISNGDGEDAIYTCALCKLEFHSVDDLKLHSSQYCQGGPSSAPISPVGSPSFKFNRSNSINMNLTEFNNPNSLAKLARNPRSLAKLAWYQLKTKPSNLVLTQLSVNTNSTTSQVSQPSTSGSSTQRLIDAPLPSPGPLLGKTPLVEAYNNSDRKSDDVIITRVHEEGRSFAKGFSPKRLRFDNYMQPAVSSPRPPNNSSDIPGPSPLNKSYMMCGGDITPLEKKDEPMRRFLSSGGCMIPLSDCPDVENSPKIIRTPLLSGGSFTEISPKSQQTPKIMISIPSLTPSLSGSNLLSSSLTLPTQFQFPPINSITAYNPLTLPPVTMGSVLPTSVSHGDKIIPFVPGIPGPNSLLSPHLSLPPQKTIDTMLSRNISPNRKKTPSPLVQSSLMSLGLHHSLQKPIIRIDDDSANSNEFFVPQRVSRSWIPPSEPVKKSFNFTRIADNLSPRKPIVERPTISPERVTEPPKQFTFDKTSTKVETSSEQQSSSNQLVPLHVDVTPSSKEKDQQEPTETVDQKSKVKSKFLRPTSLPLKPGTFTPKCHHGITPNANTLPLISPETPRPSKACVQLYLNGHAYTYLGLKSSTKMFYCTVNGAQPSYIPNLHRLSMYSVWQVCAENNPHPLGLKPKAVMSLYDSRQRILSYSMASIRSVTTTVHSQATVMTPFENNAGQFYHHQIKSLPEQSVKSDGSQKSGGSSSSRLVGGYESNEDYTYVRGRGRGRYVCSECGIRCKKPSMLKKHIRTHTDVRPYTCQHCSFSFKTKGNLTKHMQSKTHYKKCLELGINPGPLPMDELMDIDGDLDQQSINSGGGRTSSVPGESDSDDSSDGNDGETESSDTDESKSRMPEHEAARCLLSLSMTPPSNNVSPNAFAHRSHYSYSQSSFSDAFQNSGRRQSDDPLFASRRVISFTSPKPPFDYQKQEQYFSNPSLHLKTARVDKFEETAMKPIDLTKPRHMEQQQYRIPDAVCEVSTESGFLKSLVSITDKIRPTTEHSFGQSMTKFNEDVLLQAYLTEQALKYTKIKQSQMSKTYAVSSTSSAVSTVPICSIKTTDVIRPVSSPGLCTSVISIVTTAAAPFTIPRISIQSDTATADEEEDLPPAILSDAKTVLDHRIEHNDNDDVLVTISETRSKSPQRTTPAVVKQNALEESSKDTTLNAAPVKSSVASSTGSAKSVASEYLKMTSAECLKSRNTRMEESEDSSSDQETNAVETGLKPSADFSGIVPPTVIVGGDGFKSNSNEAQLIFPRVHLSDDGRPVCKICFKTFQKQHQMVLHMNIHYMERKFKCEPCAVSFRTQGHLQKHERSEAHKNKVMMNSTFGVPTTSNPRPFECSDCKVAFRIHGHLAKHLRSKTHVQKLECLQKLPFGTYAEIERAGISLTEIDTTDCDNSLASLRVLAQRLIEKDPNKMGTYTTPSCIDGNSHESGSEDSPDAPNDGPESSMGMGASGGSSSTDSLVGVKRKFDSFSSCSNDSTSNTNQQELGLEKRVRTTSSEI